MHELPVQQGICGSSYGLWHADSLSLRPLETNFLYILIEILFLSREYFWKVVHEKMSAIFIFRQLLVPGIPGRSLWATWFLPINTQRTSTAGGACRQQAGTGRRGCRALPDLAFWWMEGGHNWQPTAYGTRAAALCTLSGWGRVLVGAAGESLC